MIFTTRQGLSYALGTQRLNGFGIVIVGWIIYRPGPHTWLALNPGDTTETGRRFETATAVLDAFFPKAGN